MKSLRTALVVSMLGLCTACVGTPVSMGSHGEVPGGTARTVTADACGFQLLLLIPIGVNGRAERAYHRIERQAAGDFITDVQVRERWTWGFFGTSYCTMIVAKAIHGDIAGRAAEKSAGVPPQVPPVAKGSERSAIATEGAPAATAPLPSDQPVAASGIAIKAQPRIASETLGTLPAGTDVTSTHRVQNGEGNWRYVQYGPNAGWINESEIKHP